MQNELDAYFEYLRSARQLSGHSLDAYRRDLDKVLTYCERERIAGWRDLQGRHLRHLIAEQHRQGQSSRSLARLLSSVRGLYRYLNQEGLCEHDPATGLSAPRANADCRACWIPIAPCSCSMAVSRTISSPVAIRRCSNCSIPPVCVCPNWSV